MSDIIHLLPDSVANQIAAGEVIQRPASVIKELMENSIDAGAKHVKVIVKGAGRTFIQVIDDGKGMSATDARMAFERHATSKIKVADDLFTLRTMGFRGEALPSIVAVSSVELRTRTIDDEVGTMLRISASNVESQEDVSTPVGTSFLVKNLFFNIPARRKFLKSDDVELRHIVTEFQRVALATPQVAFSLYNGESVMYDLPMGNFRQRVVGIFGKKSKRFEEQIVPVNLESSIININGFVGKPEIASKSSSQFFFVNGRYMRHPYFHRAIMQAYSNMIAGDVAPSYFLNLEVNPQDIDVNISPTKTEIKFDNEKDIWQVLMVCVKEALGKFNIAPSLNFDQKTIEMPVFQSNDSALRPPDSGYSSQYNPFAATNSDSKQSYGGSSSYSGGYQPKHERGLSRWDDLYSQRQSKENEMQKVELTVTTVQNQEQKLFDSEEYEQVFLYKGRWLMTAVKSGIMIIDSHRANERIAYETLLLQLEQQQCVSQHVLFPDVWELTPELMVSYELIKDDLYALGFQLNSIGSCAFSVEGVPASVMDVSNIPHLLDDLLAIARDNQQGVQQELFKLLAAKIARSSVQQNITMQTQKEMRTLIDRLFACQEPTFTPDGKCIAKIIADNEWLSQF